MTIQSPSQIDITVNGEPRELPSACTLPELLEQLELHGDRVAVEYNRTILPRARFAETTLQDGDRLEIVHFVGGG
jgi:sulfur carrier protein